MHKMFRVPAVDGGMLQITLLDNRGFVWAHVPEEGKDNRDSKVFYMCNVPSLSGELLSLDYKRGTVMTRYPRAQGEYGNTYVAACSDRDYGEVVSSVSRCLKNSAGKIDGSGPAVLDFPVLPSTLLDGCVHYVNGVMRGDRCMTNRKETYNTYVKACQQAELLPAEFHKQFPWYKELCQWERDSFESALLSS